jgi:type IV secretion system protein VirD4
MARTAVPQRPTLVMIDEAAALGTIDQLPTMYGYLRGSGVIVYSAWQSLGQLTDLYPVQYRTIIENCAVLQTFGLHSTAVNPLASLIGISPMMLRSLSTDEQVAATSSREPEVVKRVDYRTHPLLRELADPNPRYRQPIEGDIDRSR